MKKFFSVLRECPLFHGVEDEKLLVMLECLGAKVEFFDKKYTIVAEGNPAKYIGVLLEGTAQIVRMDYYGNRTLVSEITPAEVFGEAFACAQVGAVPVSIIANEPCTVMLMDATRILQTCHNPCGFHQQLIFNLMRDLAMKNLQFHQKIEITSKRTTREKLLTYLTLTAKRVGSDSFTIPFDRQELADYLEVDRSGLSAEIGKLRREGVLESRKNHFTLN